MGGTVAIIILLIVVVPVLILISGFVVAGFLGWIIKKDVDVKHAESELLELSEFH